MQLENMTARVRPRQNWEAMDLGFMLVQQWWGKIAFSWVVFTLPVFILINALLIDHHIWAMIAFWWLLPIFDRIPLHIISRALFSEVESNKKNLKSIIKVLFPHFIKMLTILRFDPSRSFNLPVWQLEKLKGHARAERARVLKKMTSGSAFSLTFMCMLVALIVFISLLALVFMFVPDAYTDGLANIFNPWSIENSWWAGISINFLIYIAFFIVQPFYVAAGFSLYINRRTQLEGWDIEIVFRQLAQRVGKSSQYAAGMVLILSVVIGGLVYPVNESVADEKIGLETVNSSSQLNNAGARKAIDEIMAQKEFGETKTVTRWRYIGKKKEKEEDEEEEQTDSGSGWSLDWLSGLSLGLGVIGEVILWVLVAALIGLAVVFYLRWKPTTSRDNHKINRKLPKSLFGLEITPESLPDDVGQAALALWNNKDPLLALSLLYRGSLTTLVHHYGINLKGSATEGDCIRMTFINKEKLRQGSAEYFKRLTQTWLMAAYAHRLPSEQEIIQLSEQWAPIFGGQT